jgi:cytoskeletal protein CcmA (bactofilin family)
MWNITMWGRKKPDVKDGVASRLGANLRVKGEITGSEDLVIEGSVEGLVQLDERKLTIGKTAKVTADIIVGEVLVYGVVKGDVRAKSRIEVKKDGSVDGDLNTAQIMIEDGAFFKGSIETETTHTVEPSRPKSAEVEQPVPQPKDARVPSFCLADTPQSPAEKDDEKQLVETSKASSGTQALSPQPVESSALSDGKEAVLPIFRDPLSPKERRPHFVSLHGTSTLFPTPEPPAKTSVNKRATPPHC